MNRYNAHYSATHNRRGYSDQPPLVEFPPTLPRGYAEGGAPAPPPHQNGGSATRGGGGAADSDYYRPLVKSRSYADWGGERRGSFGRRLVVSSVIAMKHNRDFLR